MATLPHSIPILLKTFKAEAAMTTNHIAVKTGTNEGEVNIAGDGEKAIGILQTTAATAGDLVSVMLLGISVVKANDAYSVGDLLNSGAATGKVDTSANAEHGIAIALEAATAQDDEMTAFVCPQFYIAA